MKLKPESKEAMQQFLLAVCDEMIESDDKCFVAAAMLGIVMERILLNCSLTGHVDGHSGLTMEQNAAMIGNRIVANVVNNIQESNEIHVFTARKLYEMAQKDQ